MEPSFSTTVALVLAVVAAIFIFQTFKIVPQQNAWVVERLGKYDRTLAPGLEFVIAVRRARRLQALAEGSAARRAEPGLHHARQHPAPGRRHHLFPGHRPDARELRLEQLHLGDHAAGADAAALGDRQDGARPDVRGARPHQPLGRRGARRGGAELGRQGAALRDQGPDAAGGDPARDAGADHGRAREARADRRLRGHASRSRSTSPPASARRSSPAPRASARPRSTRRRARRRRSSPSPRRPPRRSARSPRRSASRAASRRSSSRSRSRRSRRSRSSRRRTTR